MRIARIGKPFSSRKILISSFIILILITVSVIGFVVFSQWWSSTEAMVSRMESDLARDISAQLDVFLSVPLANNATNYALIQTDVVDLEIGRAHV